MIYTYQIENGTLVVDTESEKIKRRLAWISDMAGLKLPVIKNCVNRFPEAVGGNIGSRETVTYYGFAEWEKDGLTCAVDLQLIGDDDPEFGPRGALVALNFELNLGMTWKALEGMIYREPAPPEAQADWKEPGALIGPPIESEPGWFMSRRLGNKEGDEWTGKSGAKYRYGFIGAGPNSIPFMKYPGWQRI